MATQTVQADNWQSELTALQCHASMFDKSLATDVTFVVSNTKSGTDQVKEKCRTIHSHKYMLASRSPVFWAMFYGELPETKKEIVIDDANPDAFYKVLRYMYTDEIEIDPELVMFIWYIAKKYMLATLITKCAKYLEEHLCPENVATIFDQCLFFEEKNLAAKCMKMIRLKTTSAIQSASFVSIRESTLGKILDDTSLVVQEIDIFKACQVWAKAKCEEENIEVCGKNIRRVLGEVLNKIHFPAIPCEDFNAVVAESEVLPLEDELQLFRYISVGSSKKKQDIPYPFDGRQAVGSSIDLVASGLDGEYDVIDAQQSSFVLDVVSDTSFDIQGLYICDSAMSPPQGKSSLAVTVTINGLCVLGNQTNKLDLPDHQFVKKIHCPVKLKTGENSIVVNYQRRCMHCNKSPFTGQHNCRGVTRNPPPQSGILHVIKKEEVTLHDNYIGIIIKNRQTQQMPLVGIYYNV